ncbi:hypothetical protein JNJ66_07180 [Candidatus Saccharibacteria bacterium]|nr:hypothetical protein [Candidatus Saccharibacteria bacterium]
MTDEFITAIPPLEKFEARFDFVRNGTLKSNAAIYLRYITLLIASSDQLKEDNLSYTLYKDIIVYTASIVESIFEYSIREYIVMGKAKEEALGFTWHYTELSQINHDCSDFEGAKFTVVKKEKRPKSTSHDLGFDDINSAAKRLKILDNQLYAVATGLRKKRNYIHLSSLEKSSDDYFIKSDVDDALNGAGKIIDRVQYVLLK